MKRSPMPPRKRRLQATKRLDNRSTLRRREGLQRKRDATTLERRVEREQRARLRRGEAPLPTIKLGSKAARALHHDGKPISRRSVVGEIPPSVRAAVKRRSGGLCEANWEGVCPPGPHRAQHVHHVILKAQGGPDVEWNLLHLCYVVHQHAHDVDRAGAESRGIIRRRTAR